MSALRSAILSAADAVEAARESLCELDARTGDGDHGVTMAIGARNVRQRLDALDGDDPAAILRAAAMGMAGVGGAIGPIWASGLLAVARRLEADGSDAERSDAALVALLADAADAALGAVTGLGHAKVGDKTIVDALSPVVETLRASAAEGRPSVEACEAARLAARRGADSTVDMVATVGRSSRFGEASRGNPDPGASSFALIVEALVARAIV